MKHWYCYILVCSDGTYYTGVTNDLRNRLSKHNSGKGAKYTRGRLPVYFVYKEKCESKSSALKRECAIKKMSRAVKQQLVSEYETNVAYPAAMKSMDKLVDRL